MTSRLIPHYITSIELFATGKPLKLPTCVLPHPGTGEGQEGARVLIAYHDHHSTPHEQILACVSTCVCERERECVCVCVQNSITKKKINKILQVTPPLPSSLLPPSTHQYQTAQSSQQPHLPLPPPKSPPLPGHNSCSPHSHWT